MTSAQIAAALGGNSREGRNWRCRCPLHGGVSLALRDGEAGRLLVKCWGGCDSLDLLAELRRLGLVGGHIAGYQPKPIKAPLPNNGARSVASSAQALALWQSAVPSGGTPVETYLRSRGLHLPPPLTLRFHPSIRHPSGGTWPVMIALVTRGTDNVPMAIHRTFLAHHGGGKAPVDPPKMMLGPCHGGAVRLAAPGDLLMVGEGIETCLAAMLATGHPAWAATSTSGLRALDLPRYVHDVVVLADGDDAGEAAAQACAWRWSRENRRVRIARPPQGMDFNDMLIEEARHVAA